MKAKIISKLIWYFVLVFNFILSSGFASFAQTTIQNKSTKTTLNKQHINSGLIGGLINVNDLKIGFLNNGSFCSPDDFLSDLPSALYKENGYLGKLDLWIAVPDGPWAPKEWDANSQKYMSLGPTVSGTTFESSNNQTDWSTINATNDVLYTTDVLYSDVYKPSELFDFILAPTSDFKQSWPRNSITGLREWPGRWKIDPISGMPVKGEYYGDQVIFLTFDDKTNADLYYPEISGYWYKSQRGYCIGAEVQAHVIGFQEAYIGKTVIFDLQIINTSRWDYDDVYLGIYYEAKIPWYSIKRSLPYYGMKTRYIKNEYCPELGAVFPYNLNYNYNREGYDDDDPTYFGVLFLKTPLARNDNVDNDGDGFVDEADGEELGLTAWHFFSEYLPYYFGRREDVQFKLLKGDTTGLRDLIGEDCFFPNVEGVLDLNFDAPDQIRYYTSYFGYQLPKGVLEAVNNLMSCGPIEWSSGDTLHFVFGILAADNLEELKGNAQIASKVVQNDYRRMESPPIPKATAVSEDGKVTLYWNNSAEAAEDFITGYQDFEGYKIYRTSVDPINNDWGTRLFDDKGKQIGYLPVARCDLDNGIYGFEKAYPFLNLGDDTGLFHTWTDTNVTNGVTYWYSVCSYDHGIIDDEQFNPLHFPISPMKECYKGIDPEISTNLVKAIPGLQAANFKLPSIKVEKIIATSGNGPITALIIDPFAITGHDYLMSFEDSTFGYAIYDLFDETENKLIYDNVQQTAGEEGIMFDGIQLAVKRYDDMQVLNDSTFWHKIDTGEPSNCTWAIHGRLLHLSWDEYPYEYDIRFTNKLDTSVFMKKTAPFEVWNTVLNQKSLWDIYYNSSTDTTDSLTKTWSSGDIIYIWDEFNKKNEFTLRITFTERAIVTYHGKVNNPPVPGDVAHIELKRPFRTGDKFRISTQSLQRTDLKFSKLDKVKVVPNPYTVHAGWELSSSESKIQFINLPSECTIHIFSMVGDQVRTLYHNDRNTDYEFWDLLNFSNLKVSYGLYTFVVETPEGERQKGKFVILR